MPMAMTLLDDWLHHTSNFGLRRFIAHQSTKPAPRRAAPAPAINAAGAPVTGNVSLSSTSPPPAPASSSLPSSTSSTSSSSSSAGVDGDGDGLGVPTERGSNSMRVLSTNTLDTRTALFAMYPSS